MVRFRYALQVPNGVQLHDQLMDLDVDGEPVGWGHPTYSMLLLVEHSFRDWLIQEKPDHLLLGYVTGPANGETGRFSEYTCVLPTS